jgi:hypothetical protein
MFFLSVFGKVGRRLFLTPKKKMLKTLGGLIFLIPLQPQKIYY